MPGLDSEYRKHAATWQATYDAIDEILGSAYVMLNFGDQLRAGAVDAASFESRGAIGGTSPTDATWTWSEDPFGFATPFTLIDPANWLGHAPILTLNGTDEEADTPDDADYSRVTAAFSIGMWINPTDVTSVALLAKADLTNSSEDAEWLMFIDSSSKLSLLFYDTSAAQTNWTMFRPSTASIVANQWTFVVVTSNATQTAATDIALYINGAASNGSGTKDASFTAMEAGATVVSFGFRNNDTDDLFYAGGILGGPLGPFFVHKELSAAEILELYYIGAQAAGLG